MEQLDLTRTSVRESLKKMVRDIVSDANKMGAEASTDETCDHGLRDMVHGVLKSAEIAWARLVASERICNGDHRTKDLSMVALGVAIVVAGKLTNKPGLEDRAHAFAVMAMADMEKRQSLGTTNRVEQAFPGMF